MALGATALPLVEPSAQAGPPKRWVLIADWCNILASALLCGAFLFGALINSARVSSLLEDGLPTARALSWLQLLFSAEGAFYAVGEFFMVGIMASTPPAAGGGPRGTMQFAILMAGGIFFALSGLVFPPCINNIYYVLSNEPCTHPAAMGTPFVWNAMGHFGITCFMVGTLIGFTGILQAPKGKLVSPFWGVTMFFMGAWTIGIFKFWGPVLCGGFDPSANATTFDMTLPAVVWVSTWWFGLLGAVFLLIGSIILGRLSGSVCL